MLWRTHPKLYHANEITCVVKLWWACHSDPVPPSSSCSRLALAHPTIMSVWWTTARLMLVAIHGSFLRRVWRNFTDRRISREGVHAALRHSLKKWCDRELKKQLQAQHPIPVCCAWSRQSLRVAHGSTLALTFEIGQPGDDRKATLKATSSRNQALSDRRCGCASSCVF